MEHTGISKIVRLLQPGTKLSAIDDNNRDVEGNVEAYRFVQYTKKSGETSYDIEYRVKWDDGVYEWIPWSEVDTYKPQRPIRPMGSPLHRPRELTSR